MGRQKVYTTAEEKHESLKRNMRNYYQRNKEAKGELFRLRARRNYYRHQLELHPEKTEYYTNLLNETLENIANLGTTQ